MEIQTNENYRSAAEVNLKSKNRAGLPGKPLGSAGSAFTVSVCCDSSAQMEE